MPQYLATLELSSLNGANGFKIEGEAAGDLSGISVSSAGDLNGDGLADIVVGASRANATDSGASYVIFGRASGFGSSLNLSTLDGNNGFEIDGASANDYSGRCVSSVGDVNGDGIGDIIVGAFGADPHGGLSGTSYVVFGRNGGFGANFTLTDINGSNGFKLNGESSYTQSGFAVSGGGDVNGDGFADVIVGARATHFGDGETYVVFGKASGFGTALELSSLDGANGFKIIGDGGDSGSSVSNAGDVNGDGIDDLVVGAPRVNTSYVFFGSTEGFAASIGVADLDGANGFAMYTFGGYVGTSVSSAGDVNGDGFADIIVGGPEQYNPVGDGASYIVFGKPTFGGHARPSKCRRPGWIQASGRHPSPRQRRVSVFGRRCQW